MKKVLFSIFIMVLVGCFLTACSGEQNFVCPDGSTVDDITQCQQGPDETGSSGEMDNSEDDDAHDISDATGEGTDQGADPGPDDADDADDAGLDEGSDQTTETDLPEEITVLFEKARTNTHSMWYLYKGPPDQNELVEVFLLDDDMRVKLPEGSRVEDLNFDTVYFDINSEQAVGFCEKAFHWCDEEGGNIETTPDEFLFKTPLDWVNEITNAHTTVEIMGSESVDKKTAVKIQYAVEGVTHTVWIDQFRGLPVLIHIGEDTKGVDNLIVYEYKDLTVNTLEYSDVHHS
ncbi:MAG: hypothetical protein KKG59_05875 [Nanoarchaeota archaeon]|nr:hypothetical protein [Nanoarchaeota archaeon]